MEDLNLAFNEYVRCFKDLSTSGKRKEIVNSLKEFIAVIDYLASKENIKLNYLQNNEIKDLFDDKVSEDDFLEAVLVYIEVAKNLVGEYMDKH